MPGITARTVPAGSGRSAQARPRRARWRAPADAERAPDEAAGAPALPPSRRPRPGPLPRAHAPASADGRASRRAPAQVPQIDNLHPMVGVGMALRRTAHEDHTFARQPLAANPLLRERLEVFDRLRQVRRADAIAELEVLTGGLQR